MDVQIEVDISRIKEENEEDDFIDPLPLRPISECRRRHSTFATVPNIATIKKTGSSPRFDVKKNQNTKDEYDIKRYTVNGDGTFSCIGCVKRFKARGAAVRHYTSDHSRDPISCSFCNEKIKSFKLYRTHIDRKHSRKFVCPQCDKGFGQVSYFKTHFAVHLPENERPFPCKTCGKRFTQSGALKIHMKLHSGIKDYYCRYCGRAFRDLGNMVNHERIHAKVKPYKCKVCDKAFSDPSAYKRHLRTHTKEMKYFCKECPKKFTDASGLIAHRARHSKPTLPCPMCDNKFFITHQLKMHIEAVHQKMRRFQCDHCGHKSYTKSNLALHILRVHTNGAKPKPKVLVTCAYCGIVTNSKCILRRHIVQLHGDEVGMKAKRNGRTNKNGSDVQKFVCDVCGNSYIKKYNLKLHIASHHATLFECRICSELYLTKNALEKHNTAGCEEKDNSSKSRYKSKRKH